MAKDSISEPAEVEESETETDKKKTDKSLMKGLPKGIDKAFICIASAYFIKMFVQCEMRIYDMTPWMLALPLAIFGILIPSNKKIYKFVEKHEEMLTIGIPVVYITIIVILLSTNTSTRKRMNSSLQMYNMI